MRFRFSRQPELPPDWLVVGLGNPGPEYHGTRHNVGFQVVERLADASGLKWRRERQASLARGEVAGRTALLAKPLTYMNLSGRAVGPLARQHNLPLERVLIVFDDMDLPLGRMRLRPGGGAGGHNGIRSLIDSFRSQEFPRIRLGVGRPAEEAIDHVLSRFSQAELPVIEEALARTVEAVESILRDGLEAAMNRYNAAG